MTTKLSPVFGRIAVAALAGIIAYVVIPRLPRWMECLFNWATPIEKLYAPFPAKVEDADQLAVVFSSVDSLANQLIAGRLALLLLIGWTYKNTVQEPADHHPCLRRFNGFCLAVALLLALSAIIDAVETKMVAMIMVPVHLSLIDPQPAIPSEGIYREIIVQGGMLLWGLGFALLCLPSAWPAHPDARDRRDAAPIGHDPPSDAPATPTPGSPRPAPPPAT